MATKKAAAKKAPEKKVPAAKLPGKATAAKVQAAKAAGSAVAVGNLVFERDRLVAVAAYYRAERRGFAPGNEIEDWLEAEAEIERLLRG